ncbi:MAG: GntR family transcriptional regulator [Peptostreptococcales bacterium]
MKIPLYKQIKNYLEELIRQNSANPQFKLPSENQLSIKFNTSRVPPKRALTELENEGRIVRRQGKGSFIKQGNGKIGELISICLFLPHAGGNYFTEMIKGIQKFLKSMDADLYLTLTGNDSKIEEAMVYSALEKGFHGFLIFPVVYHTYNDALLRLVLRRFPIVFLGRTLPGLNISSVCCDHYTQAYNATETLIKDGHQDIGFISESGKSSISYDERFRGYSDCMHEYLSKNNIHKMEIEFFDDIPADELKIMIDNSIRRFFQIHKNITAIISTSNAFTSIYEYLENNNKGKNNIKIMTFDKPEINGSISNNSPMIVDQQPYQMGYTAAKELHALITSDSEIKHIRIEEKIINM